MGFLEAEKVAAAQIAFNTLFNAQFASLSSLDRIWEQMATLVNSQTKIEQYNWLGTLPAFTEWKGTRNIGKVRNYNYQIAAPSVDQLAAENQGKLLVAKLDTDRAPRTAQSFNIRGIPTTILFRAGQEENRLTGAAPLKALQQLAGV